MTLTQKLVQKQQQNLALTSQLRQAIEILELSNLDLQAFVDQQVLENPLLTSDTATDKGDAASPTLNDEDKDPNGEKDFQDCESDGMQTFGENAPRAPADFTSGFNREIDHIADQGPTLRELLIQQINTDMDDPAQRMVASLMIDQLDECGYWRGDFDALSLSTGCSIEFLEAVLKRLQEFHPPGIFARSLQECLMLQLRDQDLPVDPKIHKVLENLNLFMESKLDKLMKVCDLTQEELSGIFVRIRKLDPKPGLKYAHDIINTLIPDIYVSKNTQENAWVVRLNDQTLPRVLVDQDYRTKICQHTQSKETEKYIKDRYANAQWLVKALDQRAQNILKVATQIVIEQQEFFENGVSYLKPLNLKKVAEEIGVHESTVSRVTQNKFMDSPRGIFELKYFFSASVFNAWTGQDQSAIQIQHRIKQLIDQEDPQKPLSDDHLVRVLADDDICVARRTVTKYRELLKIPTSYERKRRTKRNL